MTDAERSTCGALSNFLHATRRVGAFGLLLSAMALWLAARPSVGTAWLLAALALGALERLLALRVDFDARLFGSMAAGTLPGLGALDHALGALGWSRGGAPRRLEARLRGAKALALEHAAVVGLQGGLVALVSAGLRA